MDFKDKNQLIAAVAVVVVVAAVGGFWLGWTTARQSGEQAMLDGGGDVSGAVLVGGNAIAVADQPAGMNVAISMVTLAKDGWVAIHEDRDGKPGNILGAQWFPAGQARSGSVELLRSTENGKVYYAMLHSDDGDHKFDRAVDIAISDPLGNAIMMRFVATSVPSAQ